MRRMILVPTTVAATLRARHMLVAMSLAALLVLALTLAAPVAAQEETTAQTANGTQAASKGKDASGQRERSVQGRGQQAEDSAEEAGRQDDERAADTPQEADALIIEDDSDVTVDRIEIAAADCEVDKGAVVTVDDESRDSASFTNAPDDGTRDGDEVEATLRPGFGATDSNEDGTVTSSTGVTCGRDAGAADADADDDDTDDGTSAKDAEDLQELSCDELLVLFRAESSSGQQYEDAAAFTDSAVRAQVEVCLEREIVEGTAADENLPDTGGLSLPVLAVLGVVSAAAGLSVIRGGQR